MADLKKLRKKLSQFPRRDDESDWITAGINACTAAEDVLARSLPLLIRLGDFIGNGDINPSRPDSLGERCDLIGDIRKVLGDGSR